MKERGKVPSDCIPKVLRLLEEKNPQLSKLEHWWPSYLNEPKEILPSLLAGFIKLREMFPEPRPISLDCGCGDGTVMVLAGLAGFESFGIEASEDLASIAQEINFRAYKEGLVFSEGKIAIGSYYIPQLAGELKEKMVEELKRRFSKYGCLETDSFKDYVDSLLVSPGRLSLETTVEEKISCVLGETGPNPYSQLGLLKETEDGLLLTADLVYCYPSDLFFESLFFDQFGRISTKANFLLTTLVVEEEEGLEKRGIFAKEFSLPVSSLSYPNMRIEVFGKRQ
ncbi:MAG: hypothetical protein ACOZBZ_00400 [Patescibacteria group bacterium]